MADTKKTAEEIAKGVFAALPHVSEVFVTEDGHHHLHPHVGGTKFTKDEDGKITSEEPKSAKKTEKKADAKK